METLKWIDTVRYEEVLDREKESRTLLYTIMKKERDWIGHIVTGKGTLSTLFKSTVEGK